MSSTSKQTTHGGKRSGAGRKAKYKDTVTIAAVIPGELRTQLDGWANDHEMNRSQAVVEAISRLVRSRR